MRVVTKATEVSAARVRRALDLRPSPSMRVVLRGLGVVLRGLATGTGVSALVARSSGITTLARIEAPFVGPPTRNRRRFSTPLSRSWIEVLEPSFSEADCSSLATSLQLP
jgi:hypothetical protein